MGDEMELDYQLHKLAADEDGRGSYHRKSILDATKLEMLLVCIGRINPIKEQLLITMINRYLESKEEGELADERTPAFVLSTARAFSDLMSIGPDQ